MADTLFAYGRAISQNNYANKLRMLKLLHLVLRPYQIARKCCICLRNVDLAKGRKEMEGEKPLRWQKHKLPAVLLEALQ